jgi:integrase
MSQETFPYELAEIYPKSRDITKSWYIKFFIWHHQEGKLVEKRVTGEINRIHTKEERLQAAKFIQEEINALLEDGWTIGKEPGEPKRKIKSLTVEEALNVALEIKKGSIRETTYNKYPAMVNGFTEWLRKTGRGHLKIPNLNSEIIHHYMDYIKKKGLGNKTYNNYKININALLNTLNKRERMWDNLPTQDVVFLPTESNKHAAYTKDQLIDNRKACIELGHEYLWLYIQFIYYTLARPSDLRMLKVENIELEEDRIFIPSLTKGRKGKYVDIYPPLKQIIVEAGICQYPKKFYVFSNRQAPGPQKIGQNYFYKKHKKVLEKTGLHESNRNYDLYSYKHSGNINLYNSGVDLVSIMNQNRHETPEQTMKYLRELGLFRKKDHFDMVQAI